MPKLLCLMKYRSASVIAEAGDERWFDEEQASWLLHDAPEAWLLKTSQGYHITDIYVDRITKKLMIDYDDTT